MNPKPFAMLSLLFASVALTGVAVSAVHAGISSSPVCVAVAVNADDPVTGTWEGTMSADEMPEAQDVTITLELDEDGAVTGDFTVQEQDAPFEGTFDAESSTIEGSVTDPDSGQSVEVELTVEDNEMTGTLTVEAGDFSIVITIAATREDDD